jgi:beta-glucosidase
LFLSGESVDVHNLDLVGAMPRLVKAIIDTGKPTVVVYSSGKPITEPWISKEAGALVQQFYQSEMGGYALADVLYGEVNPSGRLAVSFPRDVGTLPIYYDYYVSGRPSSNSGSISADGTMKWGRNYVHESPLPLYPFGYGLSYSKFEYSGVSASSTKLSASDTVTVSVDVTNKSDHDGKEVVQIYVKDVVSSVEQPRYRLKGFNKVAIKAGETKKVEVELDVGQWGIWNRKMEYVVEPGEFVLFVGTSSESFKGNVTVTVG